MIAIATGLARKLAREPVMLGYLALDVGTSVLFGSKWWWQIAVDYLVLLPLYVIAIRWWTRDERPLSVEDIPVRPRWADVTVLAIPVAAVIASTVWLYLHPMSTVVAHTAVLARDPDPWATVEAVARTAAGSCVMFVPGTVVLCLIVRMTPRALGLVPRHVMLGVSLIAFGIALALVTHALGFRIHFAIITMPMVAPLIYVLHIFINGFHEELLVRGLLMQRILAVTRSPIWAIVLSCVFFGAMHMPIEMFRRGDTAAWQVVLSHLTASPTGLAWAYLFYRTRSLWPGILWHTSFTTLALLYF